MVTGVLTILSILTALGAGAYLWVSERREPGEHDFETDTEFEAETDTDGGEADVE